ncbi:uncharacterized protein LOC133297454 [Gastrolobium bilobum]|uniref:uncharacterized protein LOC133297454 n=1 Tax=Gastrolobium bilobum TaxID=150636 RepID=UPI002AB2882F|nr:uncharacterized protein LOC133297454 [Gastrolobium bilobum]
MKMQELADEFSQYRDQTNQRFEQLLLTMESRFQEVQSNFRELLTHGSKSAGATPLHSSHHSSGGEHSGGHHEDLRAVLKFVKPEIPKFDGSEPNTWIFKAELFFKIQQVPETFKVDLAGLRMDGVAADWFQWISTSGTIISWETFVKAVRERFGPSSYKDIRGTLAKLMPKGSLAEYMAEFQKLMNQVTNVGDDLLMTFFVAGLQSDLQGAVQLRWPTTLHQAMQLAIAYDNHHCELRSSLTTPQRKFFPKTNFADKVVSSSSPIASQNSALSTTATESLPIKKLSSDQLRQRRELGLCYTCDEKWTNKHRCKSKMLFMIVDEDDQEGESEEEILWCQTDNSGPKIDAALHSLSGPADARSLVLIALVNSREVQVLIDSGSSHSFIRRDLATQLHLPIIKSPKMRVFMGNGEFLKCDKKCPKVKLCIQGHCFETDLFVVDLCDLSIVLGMQWLVTLGRVTHHYKELLMEFLWQGKLITLQGGTQLQNSESDVIADTNCHFLLSQDQGIQEEQVFATPKVLPPFRDSTHAIQLLDNSQSVKVKPYRYPYHHKAEIERQVAELLSNGWVPFLLRCY